MRRKPDLAARFSDKVAALVDALTRGVERLLGDPKLQPRLVPVRVRSGRSAGAR